jgi:ferredoxin
MNVIVDHDRCEGHGKCVMAAPDVFELRDDDLSYVKVADVPERLRESVDEAIRLCPRQAIEWQESA